jgi:hypothetical protein
MKQMDRDKLKLLIRNLELIIDALKVEIYSDISTSKETTEPKTLSPIEDYDEIFDDEY